MMAQCGFIMAHGRGLRVYRRRLTRVERLLRRIVQSFAATGIIAIGMAGIGIRDTGTRVRSRSLCPRIDLRGSFGRFTASKETQATNNMHARRESIVGRNFPGSHVAIILFLR